MTGIYRPQDSLHGLRLRVVLRRVTAAQRAGEWQAAVGRWVACDPKVFQP